MLALLRQRHCWSDRSRQSSQHQRSHRLHCRTGRRQYWCCSLQRCWCLLLLQILPIVVSLLLTGESQSQTWTWKGGDEGVLTAAGVGGGRAKATEGARLRGVLLLAEAAKAASAERHDVYLSMSVAMRLSSRRGVKSKGDVPKTGGGRIRASRVENCSPPKLYFVSRREEMRRSVSRLEYHDDEESST